MVLVRIRYPKPPILGCFSGNCWNTCEDAGFLGHIFQPGFSLQKKVPNSDEFCMVILLGSSVDQQKDITNHRWLKKPLRRVGRRASAMVDSSLLQ